MCYQNVATCAKNDSHIGIIVSSTAPYTVSYIELFRNELWLKSCLFPAVSVVSKERSLNQWILESSKLFSYQTFGFILICFSIKKRFCCFVCGLL